MVLVVQVFIKFYTLASSIDKKLSIMKQLCFLFCTMWIFSSCTDIPDEGPKWSPKYFGPLVNTKVEANDIPELTDVKFTADLDAGNINQLPNNQPIPEIPNSVTTDAFEFEITKYFAQADAKKIDLTLSFKNTWPIDIKQGTDLVLRNKANPSKEIVRQTLESDIDPLESTSIDVTIRETLVKSNVEFLLDNLGTNGSDGETVDFNEDPYASTLLFDFDFTFASFNTVSLEPQQTFNFDDTIDFQYDTGNKIKGQINIFATNSLPIDFDVSFDLIDENGKKIGTLFQNQQINLNKTEVQSQELNTYTIINSDISDQKDTIPLSESKRDLLKETDALNGKFEASTAEEDVDGEPLRENQERLKIEQSEAFLKLKFTGDLEPEVEL